VGIFGLCAKPPIDPDMWWHLRTGEYILENGIPDSDPGFSFTAGDRVWVTHEWLTQVFMAGLYRIGGFWALSFFFAAVVVLAFGLLFAVSPGRPYVAGLVALLGVVASYPIIMARPQMFNLLFGASTIFIVERVRSKKMNARWFWIFPVLFAMWVNMHPGYLLGLAIIGVYVIGDGTEYRFKGPSVERLKWPEVRLLAIAGACGLIAALVNPSGYRLWIYAFEVLGSKETMDAISEWRSPDFHQLMYMPFVVMLLGGWLTLAMSRRPVLWTDLLFMLGTSYAALQAIRHIAVFVIVAVPIISRHLLAIFEGTAWHPVLSGQQLEGTSVSMKRLNWAIVILIVLGVGIYVPTQLQKTDGIIRENYPVEAVEVLTKSSKNFNDMRIFNNYDWGGFLIWKGIPVFIDGRSDLYGDDFLSSYLKTFRTTETWQESLDTHQVTHILSKSKSNLSVLLNESRDWHLVHEDDVAKIFVREGQAL
jgi:hypothetical protein